MTLWGNLTNSRDVSFNDSVKLGLVIAKRESREKKGKRTNTIFSE